MRSAILFFAFVVMFFASEQIAATPFKSDPYQPVHESWERFGAVYSRVVMHYYDDVNHSRLMRAAIEGLLRELDSYSQYFDEEGLRQLRQDTTGRFAGLGITVGIKDHYPVVIAPMEGTPAIRAGLLPGDLIVAIEGEDTFDLSLEEVVNTLRGEPGSVVRITVARSGHSQWGVAITRELIKIRSVALADLIHPRIGYISMKQTRFSEDTAFEVEQALKELSSSGMKGLVLDLRGNPGGLLTQAAEVADLFLSKRDPIVSIRERDGGREETRYSQRRPVYAKHPMVVLIDGGSASAAEIVAGAIQDNDRGLVVGTASFGKGSVQTIFDLHELEDTALKLTTALYYTPSGRSIHRDANDLSTFRSLQIPVGDIEVPAALLLSVILDADDYASAHADLRARFDVETEDAHQLLQFQLGDLVGHLRSELPADVRFDITGKRYQTRNGRTVFGGGGITPDIVVETGQLPYLVQHLQRGRHFFDFVVDYVGSKAVNSEAHRLEVDRGMVEAFRAFVPDSILAANDGRRELSELRQRAGAAGWGKSAKAMLDSLENILKSRAMIPAFSPKVEPYVRASLRRELALRLHGRRASLLAELEEDPQLEEAVTLIKDGERFRRLLAGG
jgi:carboxyl-terminal processing protease